GSEGATAYLEEDLRNVAEIARAAGGTLDFTRPVAVMLIGVLQCIPDEDDPVGIVRRVMDAVPVGSYLAISHPGYDIYGPGPRNLASRLNELMPAKLTFRSHSDVARLFDGLDLVAPGLVRVPEWRPDSRATRANPAAVGGGVARKNCRARAAGRTPASGEPVLRAQAGRFGKGIRAGAGCAPRSDRAPCRAPRPAAQALPARPGTAAGLGRGNRCPTGTGRSAGRGAR